MREPGASEVLMCGSTVSPASTAFFASRPAAIITLGFEVFVHDVIAAISTSALPIVRSPRSGCSGGASWTAAASVGLLAFISSRKRGAPGCTDGVRGTFLATGSAARSSSRSSAGPTGGRVSRGAARAREARRDAAEVKADDLAVVDLASARHAVHALRLEVRLEELDLGRGPP